MKFCCSRAELTSTLVNVVRAAAVKSTLAVLGGILIKAADGRVSLCCFNLDMGIRRSIDARVEEEGRVVVPMKFFDMARKLPGDTIEIRCSERYEIKMISETADYELFGMNPDDFPELPKVEPTYCFSISQQKMRQMISQTAHAINPANARPIYTGAQFELSGGNMRIVTMDDFRIAARNESIDCNGDFSFVMPGKTLNELNKIIEDSEEEIEFELAKNGVAMMVNGYNIVSRLLAGKFMPYAQAFELPYKYAVTVNTGDILAAVDRISLVTSETHKSPVACVIKDNIFSMSCSTPIGSSRDCCGYESDGEVKLEIGLNGRLMVDAFRAADTEKLKILFGTPNEPVRIIPPEEGNFTFLLMPVRLRAPGDAAQL